MLEGQGARAPLIPTAPAGEGKGAGGSRDSGRGRVGLPQTQATQDRGGTCCFSGPWGSHAPSASQRRQTRAGPRRQPSHSSARGLAAVQRCLPEGKGEAGLQRTAGGWELASLPIRGPRSLPPPGHLSRHRPSLQGQPLSVSTSSLSLPPCPLPSLNSGCSELTPLKSFPA